jgi:type IV secretion system protein VirD4
MDREHSTEAGLFEFGLLGAAALVAWVWAGAQLAALLAHGRSVRADLESTFQAIVSLPGALRDPKVAWPTEIAANLPGAILYWLAMALVLVVLVGVVVLGVRVFRGGDETLDRRKRLGVATQGRLGRPADMRPLLVRRAEPGRFVLGHMKRRLVATEPGGNRGAVALIGPTRSGKTTAAIAGILDWQGPAVLCSVKGDLLGATGAWRRGTAQVQVFDPSGVTGQGNATWSPLRAASTTNGAVRAARGLAEASPRPSQHAEQPDFWSQMAESLMAALLCLAANAEGRTFSDVVRWVLSTDLPSEHFVGEVAPLLRALKADGDPERKAAGQFSAMVLEGLWRNDHRTVSSVYATARTIVWPWVDPLVEQATASTSIDLDWLTGKANTLYVCAPLADQHRLRPVLGGLLNDLVNQAFDRFVRTNKPLDPPLLIVLDEAATLRPDQMPSWASTVSGIGVQLVTVWQSVSQIDAAYGRHAQAILTNHLSKLFYAGMSDTDGLDYVSRLLGEEHLPAQLSRTNAAGDERGAIATVPLVPSAVLRQMKRGDALLLHGALPPAHLQARLWYRDKWLRTRGPGGLEPPKP